MTYNKTIWVDQEVKKERTYELINNSDGTTTIQDPPNNILTFGTPVNAQNLNNIENGIEDHEIRISLLEGIGNPIPTLSNILGENEIWLEGAEVSRETYAQLFEIYGTTYGEGNGETTFNLPDFRNRTIWGAEDFGYIEAGLPNITGSFYALQFTSIPQPTGCFSYGTNQNNQGFDHGNSQGSQFFQLMPLVHPQSMAIQQQFNHHLLKLELKQDMLKKERKPKMNLYNYDKNTKEYLSTTLASADPMETKIKGEFVPLVPAYATLLEPPTTGENEVAIFNGKVWEIKKDFRVSHKICDENFNIKDITKIGEIEEKYLVTADMAELIKENPNNFKIQNEEIAQKTEEEYQEFLDNKIKKEEAEKIKNQLLELDSKAIRPIRAILAGTGSAEDTEKLNEVEKEAKKLRNELIILESEV